MDKQKYELLPPLSTEEFESLKADIAKNGVQQPIIVDENGEILDGHHRYKIDPNAKRVVIEGKTEAEKKALVFNVNLVRRNLSPAQKKEAHNKQKLIAKELKKEGKTQEDIAILLGVAQNTISDWFSATNIGSDNGCIPDSRVIIPNKEHKKIYIQNVNGKTQEQIASDWGVTRQAIGKIIKKQSEIETARNPELINGNLPIDVTISTGDFREILKGIPDNSIDMIFTDPPYDKESIPLYGDMAEIAARILKPGASLITYVGHYSIGEVYKLMELHLKYFWTIAVKHSGNSARMRGKGIFVEWKPMMWWVKEKRESKNFVSDYIISDIPTKKEHEWQQGYKEAEYYIEYLSNKGDCILDPFAGSGTTLIAAYKLGRKSIGVEKDEFRANTARKHIQAECG